MGCADFEHNFDLNINDVRVYYAWVFMDRYFPNPTLSQVQDFIDAQTASGVWPSITADILPEIPDADFDGNGSRTINDVRCYFAWVFTDLTFPDPTIPQVQAFIDAQTATGVWPSITIVRLPTLCESSSSHSSSSSSSEEYSVSSVSSDSSPSSSSSSEEYSDSSQSDSSLSDSSKSSQGYSDSSQSNSSQSVSSESSSSSENYSDSSQSDSSKSSSSSEQYSESSQSLSSESSSSSSEGYSESSQSESSESSSSSSSIDSSSSSSSSSYGNIEFTMCSNPRSFSQATARAVPRSPEYDSQEERDANELYVAEIAPKANVVMAMAGTKIVDGVDTGEPCVVVGVERKVDISELDENDLIPERLSTNTKTDIIVVEKLFAHGSCKDGAGGGCPPHDEKYRPLQGGISAIEESGTACTLGAIVKDTTDDSLVALTNNHCAGLKYDPDYRTPYSTTYFFLDFSTGESWGYSHYHLVTITGQQAGNLIDGISSSVVVSSGGSLLSGGDPDTTNPHTHSVTVIYSGGEFSFSNISSNHSDPHVYEEAFLGEEGSTDTTGLWMLQPSPNDGGVSPTDRAGQVKRAVAMKFGGSGVASNSVDCAIFSVDVDDAATNILEVGHGPFAFSNKSEYNIGDQVYKSGRTTGITPPPFATLTQKFTAATVNYGDGSGTNLQAYFTDQILYSADTRMGQGGDSGSTVLIEVGGELKIVGLNFAGPSSGLYGLGCPIEDVVTALDIDEWNGNIVVPYTEAEFISVNGVCYQRVGLVDKPITHNIDSIYNNCEECANANYSSSSSSSSSSSIDSSSSSSSGGYSVSSVSSESSSSSEQYSESSSSESESSSSKSESSSSQSESSQSESSSSQSDSSQSESSQSESSSSQSESSQSESSQSESSQSNSSDSSSSSSSSEQYSESSSSYSESSSEGYSDDSSSSSLDAQCLKQLSVLLTYLEPGSETEEIASDSVSFNGGDSFTYNYNYDISPVKTVAAVHIPINRIDPVENPSITARMTLVNQGGPTNFTGSYLGGTVPGYHTYTIINFFQIESFEDIEFDCTNAMVKSSSSESFNNVSSSSSNLFSSSSSS